MSDNNDDKWEPIDNMIDPVDVLAATRFEVEVGTKASPEGLIPVARVKVFGHPHFPDGAINTSIVSDQSFVLRAADAELLGQRLIEAAHPEPGS